MNFDDKTPNNLIKTSLSTEIPDLEALTNKMVKLYELKALMIESLLSKCFKKGSNGNEASIEDKFNKESKNSWAGNSNNKSLIRVKMFFNTSSFSLTSNLFNKLRMVLVYNSNCNNTVFFLLSALCFSKILM